MEIKLKNNEIRELLGIRSPEFPKYVTQILNLANQNAQATRPKNVGRLSDLIKEFPGRTVEEWERWYLERYPDAIDRATDKIMEMLRSLKATCEKIDRDMVYQWVRDLVINKTFMGLKLQDALLKRLAEEFGVEYRSATPEEEGRGIDGYIGDIPVSIKPISYDYQGQLPEDIPVYVIKYKKGKTGVKVIVPDELVEKLREP